MDITVRVPATSANCGPGFDCLGLALNLYNTFTFESSKQNHFTYSFSGLGADLLEQEDPTNNLIGYAMEQVFAVAHEPVRYGHITVTIQIPPSRGLGSSSSAIVGGLLLANAMVHHPLDKEELLVIANRMEGHPDNVAPAIYGNMCCALSEKQHLVHTVIPVPQDLQFAVVVPEITVSTEYARSVLPNHIPFKEAVHNVGYASILLTSFLTGQLEHLRIALQDHLHVPYRKRLIPHCDDVFEAAILHGAYGSTISGSGSTLIAYTNATHSKNVLQAMCNVFTMHGIGNTGYILEADTAGAQIINR